MKILLAIDSSAASDAAVREITARPWPAGSTIEVLTVTESAHLWAAIPRLDEEVARRAADYVDQVGEELRAAGFQASSLVLPGEPKAEIIDHAAKTGADLIVVGSHGHGALERFVMGSVAKAVVGFAPCSVEIVRAGKRASGEAMRVLLATDGSESSQFAAQSIAQRPWPAGTEVRILSVIEFVLPGWQVTLEPPFDTAEMESLREQAMKHAQVAIMSSGGVISDAGLKTSESISVLVATPKEIILEEAGTWGADLIALGSHGRRGITRFVLGSVSEAVATHAKCSVEVIRKTK
jgi:nucleotide-binding universal stress UspA family protein